MRWFPLMKKHDGNRSAVLVLKAKGTELLQQTELAMDVGGPFRCGLGSELAALSNEPEWPEWAAQRPQLSFLRRLDHGGTTRSKRTILTKPYWGSNPPISSRLPC